MSLESSHTILGIDAAWTAGQPTGVALIAREAGRWRCVALAPSYESFHALAAGIPVDWGARHRGEPPEPQRLIETCRHFLDGRTPDVVAVDMPLATLPITGRRQADNDLSKRFYAYDCSVHSPTSARPGAIGETLYAGFAAMGYRLATHQQDTGALRSLIEVYPHPAIVQLLGLQKRLPYKVARSGRYWRNETPRPGIAARIDRLLSSFAMLRAALDGKIDGILLPASTPARLAQLKPLEDSPDALVCCWVGAAFLDGRANAYGDSTAAIWVPTAAG